MNKCKLVDKLGVTSLIIKSQKGQQLNEREIYTINSDAVQGLLHVSVAQKGSAFKLTYNITGLTTFRDYLITPLNRAAFSKILSNILENLTGMQEAFFNQQNLLMDFDKVVVNPATQRIYFIYVPILGDEGENTLRDFLLNIIQYATFSPDEDNSYVKDYIDILNSGINFSTFELEEYIKKISEKAGKKLTQDRECPQCRTRLKKGTNFCPTCGANVSGVDEHIGNRIYDPLRSASQNDDGREERARKIQRDKKPADNTQSLSDDPAICEEDSDGTSLLGATEMDLPSNPYLIREKTREKIRINKPSFRLGKGKKSSDYIVDNNVVSRSHADIITRGKRYYIVDLNSTNRTFVNDRAIVSGQEVEIISGTKIKLANEVFVFNMEA